MQYMTDMYEIKLKIDSENESPFVYIVDKDYQLLEVFEEPTSKTKEWSWNESN